MNSFKTQTLDLRKRFEEMAQFPNKTVANDDSYAIPKDQRNGEEEIYAKEENDINEIKLIYIYGCIYAKNFLPK